MRYSKADETLAQHGFQCSHTSAIRYTRLSRNKINVLAFFPPSDHAAFFLHFSVEAINDQGAEFTEVIESHFCAKSCFWNLLSVSD